MNKILLCIPPFPGVYGYPTEPHPGIGYLESFIKNHKINVKVLDMRLGYNVRHLLKIAKGFKPDLIGITTMSYKHIVVYNLVKILKENGYKTVLGGPHISTVGKTAIEQSGADFGIKGEAEHTLLELLQEKQLSQIKGLIWREKEGVGRIVENDDRVWITNIDEIPFPKYEGFELTKYSSRIMPLVSSRGCPYKCIYCPIKLTMGNQYRARSPESVIDEIIYWYKKGYTHFEFMDDNFAFLKNRVFEICDLIRKNNLKIRLDLRNGVRADTLSKEMLQHMKSAGFQYIAFGIESANNEVLKCLKKGETLEIIEDRVRTACELGFDVELFFMVGSPMETPQDFANSINFARKYPIAKAAFYNIVPFPGTELYEWVKTHNYFLKTPEVYLNDIAHWEIDPIFETPEFSAQSRRECLILAKKLRSQFIALYLKKRLIAKYGHFGKFIFLFSRNQTIRTFLLNLFPQKLKLWVKSGT